MLLAASRIWGFSAASRTLGFSAAWKLIGLRSHVVLRVRFYNAVVMFYEGKDERSLWSVPPERDMYKKDVVLC